MPSAALAGMVLLAATPAIIPRPAQAKEPGACGWVVSGAHLAGAKEAGYEDLDPRLRDPENPNYAPGPDSLLAYIQIDRLHHPHMYIKDRATGTQKEVIAGSQPRWSPDGSRIACTVWRSSNCTSELHIIGARSGNSLLPDVPCRVENYRWSPDSRSLAITALLPHSDMSALYWLQFPGGRVTLLDTLTVFSEYEDLTWSPDSRALVVTRVAAVEVEGEPTASDLWLFDSDGKRCQLTETSDFIEGEPKWIDRTHLLYVRRRSTAPDLGNPQRVVITVRRLEREDGTK